MTEETVLQEGGGMNNWEKSNRLMLVSRKINIVVPLLEEEDLEIIRDEDIEKLEEILASLLDPRGEDD